MRRTMQWSLLAGIAIALAASPAMANVGWPFTFDEEGWFTSPHQTITWDDEQVILTYNDPEDDPFDPNFHSPTELDLDFNATPYVIISFEAIDTPDEFDCMLYAFTDEYADAWMFPFQGQAGSNNFVFDATDIGWQEIWSNTDDVDSPLEILIGAIRFDIPNHAEYGPYADASVVVDYVAVADDPDFVPDPTEPPAEPDRGFEYTAIRTANPPIIDGTIDEASYPSEPYLMTAETLAEDGGTQMEGTDNPDLSATYWITWDDEALYFAARVTDPEVVLLSNQGGPLNNTDGVQLATDHLNLQGGDPETPGIHIHDIVPGQADDPDTAAYWQHWNGNYPDTFPNAEWAGRTTDDGYEVELKLLWGDFEPSFEGWPTINTQMGILFLLMDFAADGEQLDLWFSAGDGENIIGDPSAWNDLTLDVDPTMDYAGDGWSYEEKEALGLNPFAEDSSGDGVPDWWIFQYYEDDDWLNKALNPAFGTTVLDQETGFTVRMAYQNGFDPHDLPDDLPAIPASDARTLAILFALMLGLSALLATAALKRRTQ